MRNWGVNKNNSSDSIVPKEWLVHFQKLLSSEAHTPQHLLDELIKLEDEAFFSKFDAKISNTEIEKAINQLNKKASPGPDNISSDLICAGKNN